MSINTEPIKAIFMSNSTGQILLNYINDPQIQAELLSAFISGLCLFGKESIQKIEEITIKGPDLEVFVVQKHGIILTAIFSSEMKKFNLRDEAETVLNAFYSQYSDTICNWDGNICCFDGFTEQLKQQINDYFNKIKNSEIKPNQGLGFWSRLFKKKEI